MEELNKIKELLGTLRVDGWENFEKLVYIKLLIEKLIAGGNEGGLILGRQNSRRAS